MFEPHVPVAPPYAVGESVSVGMTPEGVAALAPDAKVAAAGRKLGAPKSWEGPGRSDDAIWGECRGSAVYQVRVDLSDLAVKCSCPSRKHPCKHGIGLLFLHLETPLPTAPAPDWVTDWVARRAAVTKARKSAGKSEETTPDPEAKAKRARKRLSRVAAGLDALDLWMEDLLRDGLATAGTRPATFWETQAKRLVDAQAPGVAARLRHLSGLPNSSVDWPEKLLGGLGRLALLSEAFRRLDALEEPLAESVKAEVGLPLSQEEVLERGEKVFDGWIVLGQNTDDEGRLKARRTWLLGEDSQRYALILQFAASGTPFTEGFVSGTVVRGELAFYPGAYPLRAVVRSRTGEATRVQELPGHGTLEAFLDHTSTVTSSQPWLERLPATLEAVVPLLHEGRWLVRDRDGEVLPLAGGDHWTLLSLSGGHPVALAAEWDGETLLPLGVVAEGTYRMIQGVG
jgi:SWIM zinc finger